jgi:hypothetical protein
MFEIRKLEGKGNGIVATEPIKAGAVIHHEQPLMRLTPECLKEYNGVAPKGIDKLLAAMSFFRKQMTPEQQDKYLSLHGGQTTGPHADNLRPLVEMLSVGGKSLSDTDKVQNIGVALVMSNNAFGTDDDVLIYETASRFCHSCESNCTYTLHGSEIIVQTLVSVQAGEELTLDYNPSRRLQPTHVRRLKWLEVKDFTCHCPRCDAPGDDTRQLHCHDPECPGRHFVCQPLNKDPLKLPALRYTGAEYVEPHLLPCTVCQRSAPLEYQTAMFKLEKKWSDALQPLPKIPAIPTFMGFFSPTKNGMQVPTFEPLGMPLPGTFHALLQKLKGLKYQISHWVGFQLALHELRARLKLFRDGETERWARLLQLVTEMESMLECFFTVPRDQLPMFLMGTYAVYSVLGDSANAARLFRRLVCTLRIIYGRDQQDFLESLFYTAARRCGGFPCASAFTAPSHEGCCVYCEESPERVAMILSRCGACKKVDYCGAACQKAHWPIHKKQCKAGKSEAR